MAGVAISHTTIYRSWERGTDENTNGLLRRYVPRATGLSQLTERQSASYVPQWNKRPRQCLDNRTPSEVFHERGAALAL